MIFRHFLIFSSLVALLTLQGCASTPTKQEAPDTPEPVAQKEEAQVPTRPFSRETLYELLLAEFADKRNRADVALGKYLKQAHETRDPQVVERAAFIAYYLGAHQATLDAAILWMDIDPENPTPRSLAATELIRFGKLDDAMAQIDILINQNGEMNFEFLLQATRTANIETREKILVKLREFTTRRQDDRLWFATGALEAMNGNHETAVKDFDEAIKLHKGYTNAIIGRSQSMIAMGKTEPALTYLDEQTQQHPRNKRLGVVYARQLIQYNRLPAAQQQFERLADLFPEDGDLILSLAVLSWKNKLEDKAIEYFNQLIAMNYRTDEAYLYLASIAESSKRYQDAETYYKKIGSGPTYPAARIQLTLMLAEQNRLDDALKTLDDAIKVDENNALKYQLAKSEILSRAERDKDAIVVLDKALQTNPNEIGLLYSRAMLREKVGQFEGMEADLRKVLDMQPNNSAALNALGYTFADRNQRLDEAWELIERAYHINPSDPAIIDSMGWIKYRMGETQVALDFLRKAYEAFKDQEIAAHLGEVLWITGNQEEATRIWRQSLQDNPDSKILREVIKRFLNE